MNIKTRTIFYAILAVCFHLVVSIAHGSEADPFPTIVLPVYQGGYDIEYSFDLLEATKSLSYKIQTNYPAAEVLEFYDAALNGSGWKPCFEICQRHWASPDGGNIEGELQAKQLFTAWEHPQYRLKISLVLEYKPTDPKGRDEIIVRCRLQSTQ